jgi:hypothetical protein
MGRSQVEKGKAREREVVAIMRERFDRAQRSGHAQGEGGKHKRCDVEGIPHVWLSVKGGKAPRVLEAVDEARKATGSEARLLAGTVPAVAFRRDRGGPWFVAVPLTVFRDLWDLHLSEVP